MMRSSKPKPVDCTPIIKTIHLPKRSFHQQVSTAESIWSALKDVANEQDNMIINVTRNSLKFALIGLSFAPTFLYVKNNFFYKPAVATRIAYTEGHNPMLFLKSAAGQLKPLALAGALFGASYTLFYKYFWEGLNIQNQFVKIAVGHSLFASMYIAMLQPHWYVQGAIAGFFYGQFIRTGQHGDQFGEKHKLVWPDSVSTN